MSVFHPSKNSAAIDGSVISARKLEAYREIVVRPGKVVYVVCIEHQPSNRTMKLYFM